ncbi:LCP family protein [Candidatus Gracilibacteria bacterium]|nr:LCP family protein [Candidatus Gracilibacteria bacterium]
MSNIITFLTGVGVFILGGLFVHTVQGLQFHVFSFSESTQKNTFISQLSNTFSGDRENKIEKNTYILVTGRGGGGHEGADLTDSILLLGIDHKRELISFLSFPRDLYVDFPGTRNHGRINAVYQSFLYLGHEEAISRVKEVVKNVTGIQADYSVDVDFQGFKEIINAIGGVEVTLENNFVDNRFPNNNFGYQTFILRKGTWNLDGEVALMYARSRYSTSDFDRGLRQQQIISGVRKKISDLGYIRDRRKIMELYEIVRDNLTTDIPLTEMVRIGLALRSWNTTDMLNANYHDNCRRGSQCEAGGLLYTPFRDEFGGQSVLLPGGAFRGKHSVYDKTQQYANLVFHYPNVYLNHTSVEIYNATNRGGYASALADVLLPLGFQIDRVSGLHNLREINFEKSIIHYNRIESDNETLKALSYILDVEIEENNTLFEEDEVGIKIILADFETF